MKACSQLSKVVVRPSRTYLVSEHSVQTIRPWMTDCENKNIVSLKIWAPTHMTESNFHKDVKLPYFYIMPGDKMSYPFQINWAFVFLQIHHSTTQLHPSNKRAAVSFFYESRASTFVSLCAQVRTSKDGAGVSSPNNIVVIKETLLCRFTDFKKNAVLVWFCRCCYAKYDDEDWAKHLKRKKNQGIIQLTGDPLLYREKFDRMYLKAVNV